MKSTVKTMAWTIIVSIALTAGSVWAQVQKDDLMIGVNSRTTDSLRWIRGGDPSGTVSLTGVTVSPRPWNGSQHLQSVRFDNADLVSHNARGNLLALDYGWDSGQTPAYKSGAALWQCATDGSGTMTQLWSLANATGRLGESGVGLSVSPNNTKVAFNDTSTGSIFVMDYYDGGRAGIGKGTGATISGMRETQKPGGLSAVTPFKSQGTTWLDNNTVLSFNSYGELITVDASVAGGTGSTIAATTFSTVKTSAFGNDFPTAPSYTSILYNKQIAPNYIFGMASGLVGTASVSHLYAWDLGYNQVATADISLSSQTAREISLDSKGNLYIGGWGQDVVSVIPGAGLDPVGKMTNNSSVLYFRNDFYASYSGLDVASSMPTSIAGDANGDGKVDVLDLGILATNWQATGAVRTQGDFNGDGKVDVLDLGILATNWQASSGSFADAAAQLGLTVPEPATLTVLALAGMAVIRRRGK